MTRTVRTVRDLGAEIRRRRRTLELSQQELADRAGVGRPWLSQLEGGKRTAEIGRAMAVLDALGASLDVADRKDPDPTDIDLDDLIGGL